MKFRSYGMRFMNLPHKLALRLFQNELPIPKDDEPVQNKKVNT